MCIETTNKIQRKGISGRILCIRVTFINKIKTRTKINTLCFKGFKTKIIKIFGTKIEIKQNKENERKLELKFSMKEKEKQ